MKCVNIPYKKGYAPFDISQIKVVKAESSQMDEIMEIYASARNFMRSCGNHVQWVNGYPSREILEKDQKEGNLYVVMAYPEPGSSMNHGSEKISVLLGVFAYVPGPDPTYAHIEGGSWPDEDPYYVVHRIASSPGVSHLAAFCFEWCLEQHPVLRIDTHRLNYPMRHILDKEGFIGCGTIFVSDGTPRDAYYIKKNSPVTVPDGTR